MESKIQYRQYAEKYISDSINNIIEILISNNFLNADSVLTDRGIVASSIMEIHGLVFSELYNLHNGFEDLSYIEIGQLLSCFYPVKVPDDKKSINIPDFTSYKLTEYLNILKEKMNYYLDQEIKYNLDVGYCYDYNYDLIEFISRWCSINDEKTSLILLNEMKHKKEIFVGDFVKCCIKITNIIREMKTICEYFNHFNCLEKLNNLEKYLVKFVVTNDSLYL